MLRALFVVIPTLIIGTITYIGLGPVAAVGFSFGSLVLMLVVTGM